MKELILTMFLTFCATNAFSQVENDYMYESDSVEIDSVSAYFEDDVFHFYGIPVKDLIDNFTANMEDLGFNYTETTDSIEPNIVLMEGDIEGEDASIKIVFDEETGMVEGLEVLFFCETNNDVKALMKEIEEKFDIIYYHNEKKKGKDGAYNSITYSRKDGIILVEDGMDGVDFPVLYIVFANIE